MDNSIIDIIFSNDSNIVSLNGDLVINNIEMAKELLDEKLNLKKGLSINITNVINIDITFIQLVISLKKTWLSNNLSFDINTDFNEEIKNLIVNSGFEDIFKN